MTRHDEEDTFADADRVIEGFQHRRRRIYVDAGFKGKHEVVIVAGRRAAE
jgi:hypothetical protein